MYIFRKYISNRGSALFMVISTLTALMITCMAMYFTVLASRSTTYAIFNQKQSYQTALSIYDMLRSNPTSKLNQEMVKMAIGDKMTAEVDPSDVGQALFAELGGDFTITIECIDIKHDDPISGATNHVYDIIITTTVDGISETVHSQSNIVELPADGGAPDNGIKPVFAATGYVPNDVYLDKGTFFSDVTFDNEVTYFGAYDATELFVYGDVNCAGSVILTDDFTWNNRNSGDATRPITIAIRNTLYAMGGVTNDFKTGDRFLIGGTLYLSRACKNSTIYVNGDAYISGNNQGSTTFYVNGNVYTDLNSSDLGRLHCNGTIYYTNKTVRTDINNTTWNQDAADTSKDVLTVMEMLTDLDNRTRTHDYYKWLIDESEIPEVKEDSSGNHVTINTSTNSHEPVYIVHKDAYGPSNNPYGNDATLDAQWKTGCYIDDIIVNSSGYYFLIIDTGDDPDNTYTIRVAANRTGEGGKKYFSWTGEKGDSVRPIVLVKGNGSVVIDVPDGVIYQDVNDGVLCHYNWWILCGREVRTDGYDGNNTAQHLSVSTLKGLVHTTCGENCTTDCDSKITTTSSSETCTRTVSGLPCGETKVTATCSYHDISVDYCPVCEPSIVKDISDHWTFCKDHVDKRAVDSKAGGYDSKLNKTLSGDIIYPNCNIFLISSGESSEFRFGKKPDGSTLSKNMMIGFVYAPYQTFAANNADEGDFLKFMGGMTVSDYGFLSKGSFIMCHADKNPIELMGKDSFKNRLSGNKSWKIELITH
ncbi:MAG: hypothetical protein J1F04_02480 [Oscillospiraceae bacterium]|nr:hypothetical protein [Oscillospiraceae bacterium]